MNKKYITPEVLIIELNEPQEICATSPLQVITDTNNTADDIEQEVRSRGDRWDEVESFYKSY